MAVKRLVNIILFFCGIGKIVVVDLEQQGNDACSNYEKLLPLFPWYVRPQHFPKYHVVSRHHVQFDHISVINTNMPPDRRMRTQHS